jgi:hypothetical protein
VEEYQPNDELGLLVGNTGTLGFLVVPISDEIRLL